MADTGTIAKEDAAPGRSAAGQDLRKRRQIVDGARRVFLAKGFDAASMSDVAEEAGVSKGTLYVYFANKEDLFADLVREEKAAQFPTIFALDPSDHDVRAVLTRLGRAFARFLIAPHVVMATRTVVAMADRMPKIAADFFEQGPRLCAGRLAQYIEAQVAAGVLVIDDVYLASAQFLELAQATIVRPLMFGSAERVPLIDGPRDDEHVRFGQRAIAAAGGLWPGLRRQSLRPGDVGKARQAGRRAKGEELQPFRRLGIEVDDFALEVFGFRRFFRLDEGEGRRRGRFGDRIEAKVPYEPLPVDSHDAIRPTRHKSVEQY